MTQARIASYNIRSLRDDRAALARVIRALAPDALCVQEAPRFWRPNHQARRLARRTALEVLSGGADTASGPLLLGRPQPRLRTLSTHDRLLPRTPGLHRRGFATAVVRIGGSAPFSLTSCHLSLNPAERYTQCELLLEHLAELPAEHAVVAGDFNEHPEDPGWRLLARHLQDAWATAPWGGEYTSVPRDPYQRIDAVFCSPGVRVVRCGVPSGLPGVDPADLVAATDHLPVLAELELPAP
ncbi:endonuclease/exonuclease/phosphatase family protein [Phaeacidiphilus oryzae]|uniref:endonuclease/exonuclease/phosphatase family protein n=1 Tax=Phaeacidiphilus oryzae TaxID=348818 RepID=UPI00055B563E|nr:endonuclease/exonuclease/phosphatase family protein [Phaeacidiphilus oryzae]